MDTFNKKKAIAYIFSGTGNTFAAGEMLKQSLSAYSMTPEEIEELVSRLAQYANPETLFILSGSIPQGAEPDIYARLIRILHEKGASVLLDASGEPFRPNNASSFSLCRILRKKGFDAASDMHMLMPYNIMFRYPKAMAKQMYIHTHHMADVLAKEVSEGDKEKLSFNPVTVLWAYLLRLQWFGAWVNGPLIKAKPALCTSCGKCAKICPAGNIQMIQKNVNGEVRLLPKFHGKCTMCMNCTMNCPTGAINPGFLTPWKVNGAWDFEKLMADDSIPDNWTDNENARYFKLFRNYYRNN